MKGTQTFHSIGVLQAAVALDGFELMEEALGLRYQKASWGKSTR